MTDPIMGAMWITTVVGIVATYVYLQVRADWRYARSLCVCQHINSDHSPVSADGMLGSGKCHKCLCRAFHAGRFVD